jgi:hypothetical protein
VLRYLLLGMAGHPRVSVTVGTVNGEPAIVLQMDGRLATVAVPQFDGERIVAFHATTNPDKLAFAAKQTR